MNNAARKLGHSFLFLRIRQERAVAALPSIIIMGSIILEIAVVGAFLAYLFSQSGYGLRLSAEALNAARAGAQDAILRVVRNKDFPSGHASEYTITNNGRDTTVVVLASTPSSGFTTITSDASALSRRKKIKVVLAIDSLTGKVDVVSYEEITI